MTKMEDETKKATLIVSKEEMLDHLRNYFTDEVESCPLNAKACVEVFFYNYGEKEKS